MQEIRQPEADYSYVFSRYIEPVAHVQPGETVAIYTEDAFTGKITRETDLPSNDHPTGAESADRPNLH